MVAKKLLFISKACERNPVGATLMRVVSPFDKMGRLFDRQLTRRGWMRAWRTGWPPLGDAGWTEPRLPRVDLVDRKDDIAMCAEVPGIEKRNWSPWPVNTA